MRASRPLSVSPGSEDKRRRPPSTSVSSVQFEDTLPRRWSADPEETYQATDGPKGQERHDHPAHDDHSQRAGPSVVEPRTLLSRRVSVVTGGYESSGSDVAPALPTSSSRGFQELKASRKGPDAGSEHRRSRASSGTGRHVRHPQTPKSKGKARERLGGDLAASLGLDRDTKELALTPDQIHTLLRDPEVASALRLFGSPSVHEPHHESVASSSSLQSRSDSPLATQDLFIAHAPAPLTDSSPGRVRQVSMSSMASDITGPSTERSPLANQRSRPDDALRSTSPADEVESEHTFQPKLPKKSRLSQVFSRKRHISPERRPVPDVPRANVEGRDAADRDRERRVLEQERREAELAQERRFRALTQIAAHPTSERTAFRVTSHLRAFYNAVYEGIDHPPKMNALAILRWKHKTEEQNRARQVWHEEQNESRSDLDSLGNPGEAAATSQAGGWTYTVDDIRSYNESSGVVNYFVPPHRTVSPVSQGSVEHTVQTFNRSQQSLPVVQEDDSVDFVMSPEQMALSRVPTQDSNEPKRGPKHHSSIGQHSITHALKLPFEKMGSAARKQRGSISVEPVHTDDYDSPMEVSQVNRDGQQGPGALRSNSLPAEGDSHLRRLFLKGQRPVKKHDVGGEMSPIIKSEIKELETTLAREAQFRERQSELETRTQLEIDARRRLEDVQREVYGQKLKQLQQYRRRVNALNDHVSRLDDEMVDHLSQMDYLQTSTKIVTDVEFRFSAFQPLQEAYSNMSETKRSRRVAHTGWLRPTMRANDGQLRPYARLRSVMAEVETQSVALLQSRGEALKRLQGMMGVIDAFIKQKDSVRVWTKTALDSNRTTRITVEMLNAELKGDRTARIGRIKDKVYDKFARSGIWPIFKFTFFLIHNVRWVLSYRSKEARQAFRREKAVTLSRGDVFRLTILSTVIFGLVYLSRR